jgi:hypothetical protein
MISSRDTGKIFPRKSEGHFTYHTCIQHKKTVKINDDREVRKHSNEICHVFIPAS